MTKSRGCVVAFIWMMMFSAHPACAQDQSNPPQSQQQTVPDSNPNHNQGQQSTQEPKPDQNQNQNTKNDQQPSAAQQPPDQQPSDQSRPSDKTNDKDDEKKDEGGTNPAQVIVDKTKDVTTQAAQATKEAATATLTKVRDWETEWLIGAYVSRNRKLVPLSLQQREDLYLRQTFTTSGAYLIRMFGAGIDQARGSPRQWDGGFKGYLERWGSRQGQFFASNSLSALGNAKLHYEVRYDQCRCRGFWPRTRHAIVRNFLTYDETESTLHPQWALYGGSFGGGMISTAWKPKPRNPFAEGGRAMLGQAGFGVLYNFFTEFAVDINRKLGAKK